MAAVPGTQQRKPITLAIVGLAVTSPDCNVVSKVQFQEAIMRDPDQHLPEAVAKRVLMRAAELDASRKTSLSIPDLRAAALEAGISSSALDQALNEVANSEEVAIDSDKISRKPRRRLVAGVAIAVTLIVLATSYVFMRERAVPVADVWYPIPTVPPAPPPPPPAPAPLPR